MKVVCIDNINFKNFNVALTLNKIYDVIDEIKPFNKSTIHQYSLVNDFGNKEFYKANRFITLTEYRKRIINDILNEGFSE